jgi:hypothetical protein
MMGRPSRPDPTGVAAHTDTGVVDFDVEQPDRRQGARPHVRFPPGHGEHLSELSVCTGARLLVFRAPTPPLLRDPVLANKSG